MKLLLDTWLEALIRQFADRILPADDQVAMVWDEVAAAVQANGRTVPAIDGLIAATALRHGLALMTRNLDDFTAIGVRLNNPWAASGAHDWNRHCDARRHRGRQINGLKSITYSQYHGVKD